MRFEDHDPQLAAALAAKSVHAAIEARLLSEASRSGDLLARMSSRSDPVVSFLADLARGDLEWTRGDPHQGLDLAHAAGQPYLACDLLITMTSVEAAQGRDRDCGAHAD